ncbi:MAG: hypothetical protein WBN06_08700 [Lysobacterales bacterium]
MLETYSALGLPARLVCIRRASMTRLRTSSEVSILSVDALRIELLGRNTSTWMSMRSSSGPETLLR